MSNSVTVVQATTAQVSQVGACIRSAASKRPVGQPVYRGVNRSFVISQISTQLPGMPRVVIDSALDVLTDQRKIELVKGPFGLITLWQL